MHFHGTNDLLVNYDGGLLFIGAQESVAIWAARNGCGEERSVTFENGAVTCESYDGCTETTLCTIAGAGHCWPGQGFCNDDISASEAMWTFFSGHALP